MPFHLLLAALIGLFFLPVDANAASCTASVGSLAFGSVDTLSSSGATSSSEIDMDCTEVTSGSNIAVCIYIGAGSGAQRVMISGTSELEYGLYADANYSISWGAGGSSDFGDGQGLVLDGGSDGSASGSKTLYGSVAGDQISAAVGTYTALISNVTVYYVEGDSLDCDNPSGYQATYASLSLTASVIANCNIAANDLNFGTTGLITENIEATSRLEVECTPGASFSIALGKGNNYSGSNRRMRSGEGNYIAYGLYQSSDGINTWGATSGSDTVEGEATGNDDQIIYGLVPPQTAVSGFYTDIVLVTITYY